jgi:hypothetical protein
VGIPKVKKFKIDVVYLREFKRIATWGIYDPSPLIDKLGEVESYLNPKDDGYHLNMEDLYEMYQERKELLSEFEEFFLYNRKMLPSFEKYWKDI